MDYKTIRTTLVYLFLVLSTLVMTACGSQVVTPTDSDLPNSGEATTDIQAAATATSQQIEPTLSADAAKDAVIHALQALSNQANVMEVTTTLADSSIQHSIITFVPPDSKQIVDLNSGVEYIIIGPVVYAKDSASGQWTETSIPASTFMGDVSQNQQNFSDTISEVQLLPAVNSAEKNFYVVHYLSTSTTNGVTMTNHTEIWLDQADGLAYKMIMDGEVYSASTDPSTGESKTSSVQAQTTTNITYDPNIAIEVPIP